MSVGVARGLDGGVSGCYHNEQNQAQAQNAVMKQGPRREAWSGTPTSGSPPCYPLARLAIAAEPSTPGTTAISSVGHSHRRASSP